MISEKAIVSPYHIKLNSHTLNERQVSFAGHGSHVMVLPIQKVSQTLLKANLRPKNIFLGLIRPKVSFWDTKVSKCLEYFLYW